jgi:uncharacterized protein (TIGR03086 family)
MSLENNWRSLLRESHDTLRATVAAVPGDAWQAPTPCEQWNVTQVLQHTAGDQIGYAGVITGGPMPAEDPFQPSGRLSQSASDLVEHALGASATAFAGVADDAPEVPVPLPGGPLPAWLAAGACALDAGVHSWDIAVATGQPSPLSPELAAWLLGIAEQIADPLRPFAYADAIEVPADSDVTSRLVAYLGRRPGWRP